MLMSTMQTNQEWALVGTTSLITVLSRKGFVVYNVGNTSHFSPHITALPVMRKIKGLIFLFGWLAWISNNWKLLTWYKLTFVKEKWKKLQVLINIIYHNYIELLQIIRNQRTYRRTSKLQNNKKKAILLFKYMTVGDMTSRMTGQMFFNSCTTSESLYSVGQFLLAPLEGFYDYFLVNYAQ